MFHPKSLLFYFRKYYPLFLFALTTHRAHAMMSPDEENVEIVLSSKDEIISHVLDKITPYSSSNNSGNPIHFNESAFKLLLPSLYAVLYAKRQNHKPRDIKTILQNSDNSTSDNSATLAKMLELWNESCENSEELFDNDVLEDLNEKFRSCKSNNGLTDQVHCIFKPYVKSSDGVYRFVASIFWVYKLCDAWVDDYQKADMEETAEYSIKKDKYEIVSKAKPVFKAILDQLDADLHSIDFHILTAHGDSLPVLTLTQALAIIDPKPSPVFTGLSLQNQTDGKPIAFSILTNAMRDLISELTSTCPLDWPKKPFFLNSYIIHLLKQAEEKNDKKTKESCIRTSLTIIKKYTSGKKSLMTPMMIYNYPDTLWNDEMKVLIGQVVEMKMKPLDDIRNKYQEELNSSFFTRERLGCFKKHLPRTGWRVSIDNKNSLDHFLTLLSDQKNNDKHPFSKDMIACMKIELLKKNQVIS